MLFSDQDDAREARGPIKTAGFGDIDAVRIINKTEDALTLELSLSSDNPYYDGHFPDFPILPAVAQVELILRFSAEHLGTSIDAAKIQRIKFVNPVWPDTLFLLEILKKESAISFKISSPDGETQYSSGTLLLGDRLAEAEG